MKRKTGSYDTSAIRTQRCAQKVEAYDVNAAIDSVGHENRAAYDRSADTALEFHCLPAYSPELNAAEPLWHHTRVHATHNRSFKNTAEILESLKRTFHTIQRQPKQILGHMRSFQ